MVNKVIRLLGSGLGFWFRVKVRTNMKVCVKTSELASASVEVHC